MHSKRAQSNHLPSDCPIPPRRAQGMSLQGRAAVEKGCQGNRLPSQHTGRQLFLFSASVLQSCLFINRFPSVCSMTENRGQRCRSCAMGRNKDVYFSFIFSPNGVIAATVSQGCGFLFRFLFSGTEVVFMSI